jgi:UDPglucose 6-dehydrogenase
LLVEALNERERAVKGSKIAVLGFAYKEQVGDYRESPSIVLVDELTRRGGLIHLVDPYVESEVLQARGIPEAKAYDALTSADALVLMTPHREFASLNLRTIKNLMRTPIIVDGRRFFDPEIAVNLGFIYKGVGAKNE